MRWAIRLTALFLSLETALGAGYLATLGPSTLRFQPSVAKTTAAASPSIPAPVERSDMGENGPAVVSTAVTVQPEPSASSNATFSVQSSTPLGFGEFPERGSNDVLVTPQMLLEYFRHKSGHDTAIELPMNFIPPQGGCRPSSTAAYESR